MAIRKRNAATALLVIFSLLALLVSGCQAPEAAQENGVPESGPAAQQAVQPEEADPNPAPSAVVSYLEAQGLLAEEMKYPEYVSIFEGPPPDTQEDLLARIKNGVLIRGTVTQIDTARIPAGGEVWYVAAMTVRVEDVLLGNAPDVIRISAAGVRDLGDETKGTAAIRELEGCYQGTSGLYLIGKRDSQDRWEINGASIDPRELGEYVLRDRFDQAGESLVTRDGRLSIPFEALGVETPVTDDSWDGVPFICGSVQELIDTVLAERQAETKNPTARNVRLEELSVLYAPSAELDSIRLKEIQVTPHCVFYYCAPSQQDDGQRENWFEFAAYRDPSVTMELLCQKCDTEPDADGFGYRADCGPIFFRMDDTVITVCGPEGMCDYDTLRSLCRMDRIEIPED